MGKQGYVPQLRIGDPTKHQVAKEQKQKFALDLARKVGFLCCHFLPCRFSHYTNVRSDQYDNIPNVSPN